MSFDLNTYVQFALALLFVLALIGLLALAARRLGLASPGAAPRGRHRRLALVEALPLDTKRRLALVRRDGTEHLIVLGPGGETVIETGIGAPPTDFAAAAKRAAGAGSVGAGATEVPA